MKKIIIGVLGALGLGTIAFFTIRSKIAPRFWIESADNIKKEGVFYFAGKLYPFTIDGGGVVTARNGYAVKHGIITYGERTGKKMFDLYKNGKFVRELKTMW